MPPAHGRHHHRADRRESPVPPAGDRLRPDRGRLRPARHRRHRRHRADRQPRRHRAGRSSTWSGTGTGGSATSATTSGSTPGTSAPPPSATACGPRAARSTPWSTPGPITPQRIAAALATLLAADDPATAIVTGNASTTIAVIRLLGADFGSTALVGFDDFPLADLLRPGLTVVAQGEAEIGADHHRPAPRPAGRPGPADPDRHRADHAHRRAAQARFPTAALTRSLRGRRWRRLPCGLPRLAWRGCWRRGRSPSSA